MGNLKSSKTKKITLTTSSICCIILIVLSCTNRTDNPFTEDIVIISGQVENWDQLVDYQTISLINNDLASGKQISFVERINQDGTFKFTFTKYNPQDIWLKYGKESKTLFVHPGDSIFLRFGSQNFKYSTNFSGDAIKANQDIQEFYKRFLLLREHEGDTDNLISKFSPVDYKNK